VGPVTFQQGHGGSVNFLLPGFHHTQPSQSIEATLPDHRNVTNDFFEKFIHWHKSSVTTFLNLT